MKKGQQTLKSIETKNRIRKAALELFRTKGYDQSTMRDIALKAGMSVGSTYYYFKTKEELVLDFYVATQNEAAAYNKQLINSTSGFRQRLEGLLQFRLNQLASSRSFIGVLARNAADRNHPLSPFGAQTKSIRDESIALFSEIIHAGRLVCARELKPYLPTLLWLYQMGVVFFWIHDSSKDQAQTQILLKHTMSMIVKLIRLSRIPFMKPVNRSLVSLMNIFRMHPPE